MKLNLPQDFHFVYTLVGPHYIYSLVKMLQTAPKEANVVIVTNTPELLDNVSVPCKLTVVDLETLRTDLDRTNEPILRITDEDEYCREIAKRWKNFPMGILRHSLKWCVDNNITKLALCDVGCYVGEGMYGAFEKFEKYLNDPQCNGNIITVQPNRFASGFPRNDFINRMKGECAILGVKDLMESAEFSIDKVPPDFKVMFLHDNGNLEMVTYDGDLDLDGFMIGFLFQSKELLLKLYNFWNDMVRIYYLDKSRLLNGIMGHEFVMSFATEMFSRFHDVVIIPYSGIIWHERRPENDPYVVYHKFFDSLFIQTPTRREFIEANKEYLIFCYGPGKVKMYGLVDELNYKDEEWSAIQNKFDTLLKFWIPPIGLDKQGAVNLNRELLIYYYGPEKIKKYNMVDLLSFNEDEWPLIKDKFDRMLG